MKAYLRTLIAPAQTKLVAIHLVREYLQARILQSLQRAGAMQTLVTKPLPFGGGMPMDWFKIGVGHGPPGAPSFLLIDGAPGAGPTLWVGPTFTVIPQANLDAQGIATAHVPVPLTTASIGVPFYAQWMIDDRYVRSFSNAAKFTPFQF